MNIQNKKLFNLKAYGKELEKNLRTGDSVNSKRRDTTLNEIYKIIEVRQVK